jgi:hypothetical protein
LHGGVDCVGFVEEVMREAGLPRFEFPRTDHDYSRHVHNDKILDYLRGRVDDVQSAQLATLFAELPIVDHNPVETVMPGDILVLKD